MPESTTKVKKPTFYHRFKKWLRIYLPKLALSFIATSLMLFAGEAYMRKKNRGWPFETKMVMPDYLGPEEAVLRWRFSQGEDRNELGLRNRSIGEKEPGTLRILFLGDSLFYVSETSSGALFTESIETRLNEKFPSSGFRIETINAGIPGYTTYQELEFLKLHGLKMKPDLVVLGFVFNDVYYKYLHKPTIDNMLNMDPDMHRHQFDCGSWYGWPFSWSYLAHKIVKKSEFALNRMRGRPIFSFDQRLDFYLAWKEHGWKETPRLIGEMRSLLEERGVPLMAVIFPVSDQVNNTILNTDPDFVLFPQKKISAIFRDLDVPFCDLTEPIRTKGGPGLYIDYLHLGPQGNDVVEDEITHFLLANANLWLKTMETQETK